MHGISKSYRSPHYAYLHLHIHEQKILTLNDYLLFVFEKKKYSDKIIKSRNLKQIIFIGYETLLIAQTISFS